MGRILRFVWTRWADYNSFIAILDLLDWKTGLSGIIGAVVMIFFGAANPAWSIQGIVLAALIAAACVSLIAIAVRVIFWKPHQDEIQSFFKSWIDPAAQNINQVLQRVMNAIQKHSDPAVKSHGPLIQRSIIDEERAALANLSNAINGIEQTNVDDLQHRMGRYYRAYQACRTWIAQGIRLAGINLRDDPIFQEWLRLDEDLFRELRRVAGSARYDILRMELDSAGWGKIITRDLRGL